MSHRQYLQYFQANPTHHVLSLVVLHCEMNDLILYLQVVTLNKKTKPIRISRHHPCDSVNKLFFFSTFFSTQHSPPVSILLERAPGFEIQSMETSGIDTYFRKDT